MCAMVLGVLDSITLHMGMGVLDAHVCTGALGSLLYDSTNEHGSPGHPCVRCVGSFILQLYIWPWESWTPLCALAPGVPHSTILYVGMMMVLNNNSSSTSGFGIWDHICKE